jgi:hypothetical protein
MAPLLAIVITVGAAVVTAAPASSPRQPEYPHVRATDPRVAQLIADAVRRSPTFARLHQQLQQTDVILFVETSRSLKPSLHGQLMLVSATPLARYLRAEVRADLPRADLITAIAHEMQHALEIGLSEEVCDASAVGALYRRIGRSPAAGSYDTDVAYAIASRVRAEVG